MQKCKNTPQEVKVLYGDATIYKQPFIVEAGRGGVSFNNFIYSLVV